MDRFEIDNILVVDDALTTEQCEQLIAEGLENQTSDFLDADVGYSYYDWSPDHWQRHKILAPLLGSLVQKYAQTYNTLSYLGNMVALSDCRFKQFPPGYSYANWHQEHVFHFPKRVFCILVYLSDHDCGTEFLATGETVMSQAGRALVFPTFWTHTHRGQVCPDNRSRYILGCYAEMVNAPSAYTRSLTKKIAGNQ